MSGNNNPPSSPKPVDSELDRILKKLLNDFYDYMTERDILKTAHEYSEKTIYKTAKQALQAHINKQVIEGRIEEWIKEALFTVHSQALLQQVLDEIGEIRMSNSKQVQYDVSRFKIVQITTASWDRLFALDSLGRIWVKKGDNEWIKLDLPEE